MAMWKKMADAFGRAVKDPGATQKGRELVFESKTVKNRPGDVDYHGKDTPAQRAFKRGMSEGEEEYAIAKDATRERYDGEDPDVRRNVMEDEFERREDIVTDNRLEKEFDEGFNSAIARRKQDVKDWYGKDFPQDKVDEGADTFEEDLWRIIGELRDKGMSGNDILNVLKGTNR